MLSLSGAFQKWFALSSSLLNSPIVHCYSTIKIYVNEYFNKNYPILLDTEHRSVPNQSFVFIKESLSSEVKLYSVVSGI